MPIKYKIDVLAALKEKGYPTTRLRKEKLIGEATIQRLRACSVSRRVRIFEHNFDEGKAKKRKHTVVW